MQKRLQALLLTALMVWTLAAPAMGANPFFDVPEDHWAYDAISYLAEAGLVEGYPDGTFGGSRNFTRYEMALVFARIVARFEKHVDELVAQGIESRLEELAGQVSAAMNEASAALAAAGSTKSSDAEAALKAAQEARTTAEYALDVAIGILEAIDAREWDARIDAAARANAKVAEQAAQAIAAAQEAKQAAQEAVEVAAGILNAIEARGWDARIDAAAQQAAAAAESAKQAHQAAQDAQQVALAAQRAAQDAQQSATDAVEIAVGILDAIDARGWDSQIGATNDRINAVGNQAESAAQRAEAALSASHEALAVAQQAVDVAIGILEAIDARGWDARIDAADRKADQALAIARQLAELSEKPVEAALFTAEARAAIEEIATAMVLESLKSVKDEAARVAAEVQSLRTDTNAARQLIASEAARLEKSISDLTREFSAELEILGVRVARLESKFTSLEATVAAQGNEIQVIGNEVKAIRTEMDRVRIAGSNETRVIQGTLTGIKADKDPRDPDAGEFVVPANNVTNRLSLRLDAKPSDDVTIVSEADVVYQSAPAVLGQSFGDSTLYVEAQTDRPVRVVRLGSLDAQRVAKGFTSYVLDAKAFGSANIGGFVNIVSGQMEHDVFGAHALNSNATVTGFSSQLALGPDIEVAVGAVRQDDGTDRRTGTEVTLVGNSADLKLNGLWVQDVEEAAFVYHVDAEIPFQRATLSAAFNRIDPIWSQAHRLPFSAEVKTQQDAVDKPVAVNSGIFADQRLTSIRLDAPVGSFVAFAQAGQYDLKLSNPDPKSDSYTQWGVYDLALFGFDVDVTRSRFVDTDDDKVLSDQRANLKTRLEDIDLGIALHKQTNEQSDALATEGEQSHFMLSVAKPLHILVPWTGSLQFGTSFTAQNGSHSAYKLSLDQYQLTPDVVVNAELSSEHNLITDGKWRINDNWTGQNQTVRSVAASWKVADPVNLLGGYKVVNNSQDGKTVTQDAGFEYQLDAFGGDLALGYGYRLVRNNGAVDGAARNILSAGFVRTAGGFTLNANAKRILGGTINEAGNDVDTIASLQLAYPVFTGANFTVDGKWVSSQGSKLDPVTNDPRPEYSASSLMAGLKFNF